jgi:hypothetical protein
MRFTLIPIHVPPAIIGSFAWSVHGLMTRDDDRGSAWSRTVGSALAGVVAVPTGRLPICDRWEPALRWQPDPLTQTSSWYSTISRDLSNFVTRLDDTELTSAPSMRSLSAAMPAIIDSSHRRLINRGLPWV